jgi:hypothetical protein
MSAGGGKCEGKPCRPGRREGGRGGIPAISFMFHRRLGRRRGRLDQIREGSGGGRGWRKSYREVRKVNLLGWKRRSPRSFQVEGREYSGSLLKSSILGKLR